MMKCLSMALSCNLKCIKTVSLVATATTHIQINCSLRAMVYVHSAINQQSLMLNLIINIKWVQKAPNALIAICHRQPICKLMSAVITALASLTHHKRLNSIAQMLVIDAIKMKALNGLCNTLTSGMTQTAIMRISILAMPSMGHAWAIRTQGIHFHI